MGDGKGGRVSAELERVYDEAEPREVPVWRQAIAEWRSGAETKLRGQLRQAQAAYMVERHYGEGSMEEFANEEEVNSSRTTVYAYAGAWSKLLAHFGHADAISERLDDSPLTITNVIEAAKEEDLPRALDEAEDEGMSSRQQKAKRRERSETPGQGQKVEVIDMVACPHCGGISRMRELRQWTEEATG